MAPAARDSAHPGLQPPTPAHAPLARLLQWATGRGAKAPKVTFDPAYPRRFLASADIAALEPIITLPQHLLMHAGTALADPVYGTAFRALRAEMLPTVAGGTASGRSTDHDGGGEGGGSPSVPRSYWDHGGLSDRDILCMLLILERSRGPDSAWAPYIDILPYEYDDPAWWDEASLALLRGTRVARAAAAYRPGLDRLVAAMTRLRELHLELRSGTAEEEEDGPAATCAARAPDGCLSQPSPPLLRQQQRQQQDGKLDLMETEATARICDGSDGGGSAGGANGGVGSGASAACGGDPLSGWALSLDAARWARSAVWSRSFTLRRLKSVPMAAVGVGGGGEGEEQRLNIGAANGTVEGQLDGRVEGRVERQLGAEAEQPFSVCQVPVLDMIDHQDGCVVAWHTGPRGEDDFVWLKMEDVPQGAVLTNNYGSKDNQELLLAYGFVLAPNPYDYVALSLRSNAPLGQDGDQRPGDEGPGEAVMEEGTEVEAEADGGQGQEAGDLQAAAEAVQRRLVAAAAGLPSQLRLTLQDPLPEQLLQATRVALATGPRLYFAAADALSTGASGATAVRGAVRELLEPYDTVSELRVLGTVVQQLELRLKGMVGCEEEVRRLLGLPQAPQPFPATAAVAEGQAPLPSERLLLPTTGWLPPSSPSPPSPSASSRKTNAHGVISTSAGVDSSFRLRFAALSDWMVLQEGLAQRLGVGRWARMALTVVNGQRAILTAALQRARELLAAALTDAFTAEDANAAATKTAWPLSSDATAATAATSSRAAAPYQPFGALELVEQQPHTQTAPSSASDSVQASGTMPPRGGSGPAAGPDPLPLKVAINVRQALEVGDLAFRVPLALCLVASTPERLLLQLLLAAQQLLLSPLPSAPPSMAQQQPEEGQRGALPTQSMTDGKAGHDDEGPQHRSQPQLQAQQPQPQHLQLFVRQLLYHVPPPPVVDLMLPDGCPAAVRMVVDTHAACRRDGSSGRTPVGPQLLALMEGSPAGTEYEQNAMELQDDFNAFRQAMPASIASLPESSAADATAADAFLAAPPQQAFWLYCWARQVVECCSVAVDVVQMSCASPPGGRGGSGGAVAEAEMNVETEVEALVGPNQRISLLVPVMWALPKEIRSTAFSLQMVAHVCHQCPSRRPSDSSGGGGGSPVACPPSVPRSPQHPPLATHLPYDLMIQAACSLPAGLLICPDALASAKATRDPETLMLTYGPHALAAQSATVWQPLSAAAAPPPLACTPSHSLELLPAADDLRRAEKLRLMRHCGLGCEHHLGPGGRGQELVTAALRLLLLQPRAPKETTSGDAAAAAAAAAAGLWSEAQWLAESCARAAEPHRRTRLESGTPGASGPATAPGAVADYGDPDGGVMASSGIMSTGAPEGRKPQSAATASSLHSSHQAPRPEPEDVDLLSSARRVMSYLLQGLQPGDQACKETRKTLRKEVAASLKGLLSRQAKATRLAVSAKPGAAADGQSGAEGIHQTGQEPPDPAVAGVRHYLDLYGRTLNDWCSLLDGGAASGSKAAGAGKGGTGKAAGTTAGRRGRATRDGEDGGAESQTMDALADVGADAERGRGQSDGQAKKRRRAA